MGHTQGHTLTEGRGRDEDKLEVPAPVHVACSKARATLYKESCDGCDGRGWPISPLELFPMVLIANLSLLTKFKVTILPLLNPPLESVQSI